MTGRVSVGLAVIVLCAVVLASCAGAPAADSAQSPSPAAPESERDAPPHADAPEDRAEQHAGFDYRQLTPEHEYFIGRSVTAMLLSQYRPWGDPLAGEYLNTLGHAVALASSRPLLFNGYHFMILDSEEINAFSSPGGHVLLTRGLVRLAESEDELAAIVAHEVSHIAARDALAAVDPQAFGPAILEEFGHEPSEQEDATAAIPRAFELVVSQVLRTLTLDGYPAERELAADEAAVRLIATMGYDPHALARVLVRIERAIDPTGFDFAATHPDPARRLARLETLLTTLDATPSADSRITQLRFDAAMFDL